MNNELLAMWIEINDRFFDGNLNEINDIDWHALAGDENLNAFGIYMHKVGCIAIDQQFKFDPEGCKDGNETELAKAEIAYRLVLHEMIHQALHQKGIERFGKHGAEFVEQAIPIAAKLGTAQPTEESAYCWPNPAALMARYMR